MKILMRFLNNELSSKISSESHDHPRMLSRGDGEDWSEAGFSAVEDLLLRRLFPAMETLEMVWVTKKLWSSYFTKFHHISPYFTIHHGFFTHIMGLFDGFRWGFSFESLWFSWDFLGDEAGVGWTEGEDRATWRLENRDYDPFTGSNWMGNPVFNGYKPSI